MTARGLYGALKEAALAAEIYAERESEQIARILLEEIWAIDKLKLITESDNEIDIDNDLFERVAREIKGGRPLQYVVGEADFCDFRLKVREGVLIPRPESEELVRWVVERCEGTNGTTESIFDIGTGSGALAIALQREFKGAKVTAIDISDEALEIAGENIAALAPNVRLIKGDALKDGIFDILEGGFDIIVSNPPYIPQSECAKMRANVVEHEPHLALFVPDNDPLLFYRKIAGSGRKILREKGLLFFEVHEDFADQTAEMMRGLGYTEVEIRRDINDKARMVCGMNI